MEVIGEAVDEATLGQGDGSVRALSYTVAGSGVDGEITLASDGTFAFPFSTVTLGTDFTLGITATDWNGNTSVVHLPLCRQAENGIPSFAATPGSKRSR